MTVYHGTTRGNAENIKREGLCPHLDKKFNLIRSDDGSNIRDQLNEDLPLVYISPDLNAAKLFAEIRAKYERAKQGEAIEWGELKLIKLASQALISPLTLPAVIEFNLPETYGRLFNNDVQVSFVKAYTFSGVISPSFISRIIPIPLVKTIKWKENNVPDFD